MLRNLSLLLLVGACADLDVTTSDQAVTIPIGGVATNGVATNGVATNGVVTNAVASEAIATGALAVKGTIANAAVALGLEDPNARSFMKYLVSCALAPDQTVEWTNHDGSIHETWRGALALCPQWQDSPPDLGCRQRVSSCILARNNAFGVSVQFSMRGTRETSPIDLAPSVPAHDHIPQTPSLVPSLARCRHPQLGPQRNCGWSRALVGRCTPGDRVGIAEGNRIACTGEFLGKPSNVDTMLRVCPGTSACDTSSALVSVGDACGLRSPGAEFECPASGLFAVMRGAEDSTVRLEEGIIAATATYPASESEVFRWREGAFYGDIFGAANIAPGKPQVTVDPKTFEVQNVVASSEFIGVAFPNMFACSSENWANGFAYTARRVCAGPGPSPGSYTRDCAAAYAGPCLSRCGTGDSVPVGDGDYDDCQANGEVYRFPLTAILAAPCDAIPGAACATVSPVPSTW